MKVTVIGMWGGFPKKDEPTSGYLIEHKKEKILIDCGSGVLVKLQEFVDLNEINDVVLSHYHDDHACDIGPFMFSRLVNTDLKRVSKPLTIYGPNDSDKVNFLTSVPHSKFKVINEETELKVGSFEIRFLQTVHPVETYAMAIYCNGKKLVYTADTSFTKRLIPFAKNADLLIAEASLYEGMDGEAYGHLTAEETGLMAKEANVKALLLTHLPHYGDLNKLAESAKSQGISNVKLAEPNMVLEIS